VGIDGQGLHEDMVELTQAILRKHRDEPVLVREGEFNSSNLFPKPLF
jgi:hypothetical protein